MVIIRLNYVITKFLVWTHVPIRHSINGFLNSMIRSLSQIFKHNQNEHLKQISVAPN